VITKEYIKKCKKKALIIMNSFVIEKKVLFLLASMKHIYS